MDKITMKELVQAMAQFLEDPSDKERAAKINNLKSQLVVREYLPMRRKRVLLQACVVFLTATSTNSVDFAYYKELVRVFILLFGYVENLEVADIQSYASDTTYDLLQLSGVLKYIYDFCSLDFVNCVQMLDDLFKFEHLVQIMSALEAADTAHVEELIKAFTGFKNDLLSPEMLQSLNKVLSFDDPTLAHIRDVHDEELFKVLGGEQK